MSELSKVIELENIDSEFLSIINQIKLANYQLTEDEKDLLRFQPIMKDTGTSDQGYRFD